MIPELTARIDAIAVACRRAGVRTLEVFGSAATESFDPLRSDVDFIVDLNPAEGSDLFRRYFTLKGELEAILDRPVDLVMIGALRNPYFVDSVNETRKTVYAFPVSQAA